MPRPWSPTSITADAHEAEDAMVRKLTLVTRPPWMSTLSCPGEPRIDVVVCIFYCMLWILA